MDSKKRKALEAAGWRFGDTADFLATTDEDLRNVKKNIRPLFRLVLILAVALVCILAGIMGAFAGMGAAFHLPFSGPDFDYTIRWGIGFGIFGALLTALQLVVVRREKIWWVAILGIGITLLASCMSMWWDVVSSLG